MRVIRFLFVVLWGLFPIANLLAQSPSANFTVAPTGCRNQVLSLQNTSVNADSYAWDFCLDDFLTYKSTTDVAAFPSGYGGGYGYKLIQDNGLWYGFVTSRSNQKIYRLDFGNDPSGFPTVIDLGNPGGLLIFPEGIDIVKANGNWYGFVGSLQFSTPTNGVIRLDFGSSLQNAPVAVNLGNFGFGIRFRDLKVIEQTGEYILILSNYNNSSIIRINYRDAFENTISGSNIFDSGPITGASLPVGFDLVKQGSNWIMLVASLANHKILQLNFSNSILNNPTVEGDYAFTDVNRPYKVKLVQEGNNFFGIVSNESIPIKIIDFKDLNPLNAPVEISHASLPALLGIETFRLNGKSVVQGANLSNNKLKTLQFESPCDATISISSAVEPVQLAYASSGDKKIELRGFRPATGEVSVASGSITISASLAPDIIITSQNVCANHDVNFTSQNSSGDIVSYNWNFGDTNSSSQQDPVHQYISNGNYDVLLEVTAVNGCKNFTTQPLTIFNEPLADFTTPSVVPICTNQDFLFNNTTVADPGYSPSWEWRVNGSLITTNQYLSYTFTNTSNQEIRLKAAIPGCGNEIIKNINSLVDGPTPDFSFTGKCEDEDVVFTNSSSGTVTGHQWDFDDTQSSTIINPTHIFSAIGVYNVVLTASNVAGCNNTKSKSVTVYSKPLVSFAAALPPFSCSGTPTLFNDLTPNPTDSNIASWLWNFDDGGSGQNTSIFKNPQHTYSSAGNYNVLLTVETNFLCASTVQLPVNISQSPTASFNFTPTCKDVPVNFNDTSTGSIQSWSWQIGSTFYSTQSPTHTFLNSVNTNAILTVTATNNCINVSSTPIVVPAKLAPDFAVSRNCTGENTIFTDVTMDASDPIYSRVWDFATLGAGSDSPAIFSFASTGDFDVKLDVTTLTGCVYTITKNVSIFAPPVALFNATPETGAPPLNVLFENTSVNGNSYLWMFNDLNNSTSTVPSPSFTFLEIANYDVDLITYNAIGCSDTIRHQIIVAPITGLEHNENFYFETPYPNPNQGNLFLKWTAQKPSNLSVSVLDFFGRMILESDFSSTTGSNETIINLSGLTAGVYFLRIGEEKKMFRILLNP